MHRHLSLADQVLHVQQGGLRCKRVLGHRQISQEGRRCQREQRRLGSFIDLSVVPSRILSQKQHPLGETLHETRRGITLAVKVSHNKGQGT